MKNSLRIHKWTHNEFNIFILGVLTHPLRDFSCKKSDYSRLYHRYSICMLTQYAFSVLFQDKIKANFSNDRFVLNHLVQ